MLRLTEHAALQRELEGKNAVVLFTAGWCPHCRKFEPVFAQQAGGQSAWVPLVATLDDDDSPFWAAYEIDAVPTVIFFEDGRVSRRLDARLGVGLDENQLRAAF